MKHTHVQSYFYSSTCAHMGVYVCAPCRLPRELLYSECRRKVHTLGGAVPGAAEAPGGVWTTDNLRGASRLYSDLCNTLKSRRT